MKKTEKRYPPEGREKYRRFDPAFPGISCAGCIAGIYESEIRSSFRSIAMKEFKRIKDPIYGYIQIPVKYMTDIVDTAAFQRLRRILQTSYSPPYSSAVHSKLKSSSVRTNPLSSPKE